MKDHGGGEIMKILKPSDFVTNDVNTKLFRMLNGYALDTDELFNRLFKIYNNRLIYKYKKDIITNYDRFTTILTINNAKLLEKILLDHQEYFVKSLKENPTIWVASKWYVMLILTNEKVIDIILNNISYNKEIHLYATKNSHQIYQSCIGSFVTEVSHKRKLNLDLYYVDSIYKNGYISALSNYTYSKIKVEIGRLSDEETKHRNKKHLMHILIKDFCLIKQAKNYVPPLSRHMHVEKHIHAPQHSRVEKLWKLNFKRMFTYRTNMDIIYSTEVTIN